MSLLKRLNPESATPIKQNVRGGPSPESRQRTVVERNLVEIKLTIQSRLLQAMGADLDLGRPDQVRQKVSEIFTQVVAADNLIFTRNERAALLSAITAEILGFGPLEPLLADETVTEIMVNGPSKVFVERAGKLIRTDAAFDNDDHVMRVIDRIISPLGRRLDESSPMVDARLPDGSRVNAVIPPLTLNGPTITIRKFSRDPYTDKHLVEFNSISAQMVEYLQCAVLARLNILVSGGTGSGKTTMLNVLSSFIPDDERIVTIENAAELQLQQDHVITLETRPPNIENKGEVTIRDLVINSLRMRPDRIIVGEVRGGEAFDMLQAMNTGHDGSLTTLHSNSAKDAVSRLETMVLMAGMELPARAVHEQISSAIHVIIQQERMRDGTRKVTSITEVDGVDEHGIKLREMYKYQQTGFEDGKLKGRFTASGQQSSYYDEMLDSGAPVSEELFQPSVA